MGVRPAVPSGSEAWVLPLGLVGGAAVGLLLGILAGAVAVGISRGAALGLLAGAVIALTRHEIAERRPMVLWIALVVLAAGTLVVVWTWLR
jgi:hypothetical protein